MVKMEYSSLPKLIPLKMAKMCPEIVPNPAVSKWIQPCAIVRFLHTQPNINIKTAPVSTVEDQGPKREHKDYKNKQINILITNSITPNSRQSEVPATVENICNEEDTNLLPSKKENKLSEIVFFPMKPKSCRCTGPCETIICDVIVQQYVDEGKMSLMLALNIDEDEIDALVRKHCDNKYCDALSIDHDRCRRGLIKLYKCDESDICDICLVPMTGWKSRLYHKRCERKNEYRHNDVSKERLLRDRFRLRELQIMQDSTMRKNYMDPVNGPVLAMEAVRNNKELVVLPTLSPKPIVTVTTVPSGQLVSTVSSSINRPITVNSQMSDQKNIMILSPSNAAQLSNGMSLVQSYPKENTVQQMRPTQLSNVQGLATFIVTSNPVTPTNTVTQAVMPPQNRYINLTNLTTSQPTTMSNLIVPQSHVVTSSSAQSKTLLAPIRVIPITNLKTEPSLMHRQQGVPKFCVMAGNVITTLTVPSLSALQPIIAATNTAANTVANTAANTTPAKQAPKAQPFVPKVKDTPKKLPLIPKLKRKVLQQKQTFKKPNKRFFCVYCCKHFSTYWYFKKHVAKHMSQKHTPLVMPESTRHGTKSEEHDAQEEPGNDYACESPGSLNSPADRTDGELNELGAEVELDADCWNEHCADEINCRTTNVGDSNEVGAKRIKCENTYVWDDNLELSENGIKIEPEDDDDYLEDAPIQEHDVEESLTFNKNCNAKGDGIAIVSVTENSNHKNFEEESIVALR